MKQKVLVNVDTLSARKKVLSTIVSVGYDFVEANTYDDIKFKCDLLRDHIILYIHELDYRIYEEEMAYIKNIISRGIKVMLIIDNYDVAIIDEALSIGIHDIVQMPIDMEIISKKLKNVIIGSVTVTDEAKKVTQDAAFKKHNAQIIVNEIARAKRGNYEVSMILIRNLNQDSSMISDIIKDLKKHLRDTDRILHYEEDKILLICPFTVKPYVVEIENKVRNIYRLLDLSEQSFALYGLTYPKDVTENQDILTRLEKGIDNSILLGNLKGTLSDIGFEQFEAYKKMLQ